MSELSERDWELINAYADCELSAADEAMVARRLTHEKALGAALAEVHASKAALSLMRPAKAAPEALQLSETPRARVGLRRVALVASLAVLLVSGVAYQYDNLGKTWRDAPASLHADLSKKTYVLDENPVLPVISTARIGDLIAFDLSSSRLFLVDVQSTSRNGRDVVAMHYRGLNGCRLTAIALEAKPGDPAVLPVRHEGLSERWTIAGIHFYVLADGMDEHRFAAIARFAQSESRRLDQRDELRLAMGSATNQARPCA